MTPKMRTKDEVRNRIKWLQSQGRPLEATVLISLCPYDYIREFWDSSMPPEESWHEVSVERVQGPMFHNELLRFRDFLEQRNLIYGTLSLSLMGVMLWFVGLNNVDILHSMDPTQLDKMVDRLNEQHMQFCEPNEEHEKVTLH